MSDQRRPRLPASDRLPDIPFDPSTYHIVGRHLPTTPKATSPSRREALMHEQPAWWENDEPALLPDAGDWRAVSVLAGARRADQATAATMRFGQSSWQSAFSRDVLEAYGLDETVISPDWTDAELERERNAWRDDAQRGRPGGGKHNRRERRRRENDGDWRGR